jgi:hypothetical protein
MADLVESTHDIATFDEDDGNVDVLVLPGHDVIIPYEMDPESEPLPRDGLLLESVGGAYRRFQAPGPGFPDVEADVEKRRWFFRFRDVPHGAYRVSVFIEGTWSELILDLVVRRAGVFAGGKKLDGKKPASGSAPAAELEPAPAVELSPGDGGIADQVEPVAR